MEKLQKFTYDRELNELSTVFYWNGYHYATNGKVVVRKKCETSEEATGTGKRFGPQLEEFYTSTKIRQPIEFNSKILREELIKHKTGIVYKKKPGKCSACNGFGMVEWEFDYQGQNYERLYECPVCSGTKAGMEETTDIDHYSFSYDDVIDFYGGNMFFSPGLILPLLDLGDTFEIITIKSTKGKDCIEGKIGEYEFIVLRAWTNEPNPIDISKAII